MDPLGAEEIASQSVSSSQLVAPSLGASNSSTSETQALNASAPEDQYEIDLGTAWVIFTSDWDNETPGAELVLVTPGGVTLTEADIEADPNMAMVNDLITDRRRAVMVTGPEAGVWTVRLENAEAAGEVRFMALRDVAGAAVSITSTSGGLLGTPVRIDYQAFSEDPGATVSLYYDSDDSGLNGSLIAHGLPAVDGMPLPERIRGGSPANADADRCEDMWWACAWPVQPGETGGLMYFASALGEVYQCETAPGVGGSVGPNPGEFLPADESWTRSTSFYGADGTLWSPQD